jgi:hypothetical protein
MSYATAAYPLGYRNQLRATARDGHKAVVIVSAVGKEDKKNRQSGQLPHFGGPTLTSRGSPNCRESLICELPARYQRRLRVGEAAPQSRPGRLAGRGGRRSRLHQFGDAGRVALWRLSSHPEASAQPGGRPWICAIYWLQRARPITPHARGSSLAMASGLA